jgi:hypothetical protein
MWFRLGEVSASPTAGKKSKPEFRDRSVPWNAEIQIYKLILYVKNQSTQKTRNFPFLVTYISIVLNFQACSIGVDGDQNK